MPNSLVPAAAEGLPKFDRAAVMRKAWEIYRDFRARYGEWQIKSKIIDASFSNCLKISWRVAKREAAERQATAAALATYGDRAADRVRELTDELTRIDAQPWGMQSHRIANHRNTVAAELAAFSRGLSH